MDGDARPPTGYIYEAMDRAKEEIAKNFYQKEKNYKKIWVIVYARWDMQLHTPLHAAAYFLYLRFQYAENFKADGEVKVRLYKTIERMYPNIETRLEVDSQITKFKNVEGMFGMEMTILTREKKQPALWWESFGEECPEL